MADPIPATCQACGRDFLLREVVRAQTGACPTCGTLLTPQYSFLLFEEAQRAEDLAAELTTTLNRLAGLPGNLALDRDAVYRAITAALPAAEQQRADRVRIAEQGRELRRLLPTWIRQLPAQRRAALPRLRSAMAALAQRLRLAAQQPQLDSQQAVLREAAATVEQAAAKLHSDSWRSHRDATAALKKVTELKANGVRSPDEPAPAVSGRGQSR